MKHNKTKLLNLTIQRASAYRPLPTRQQLSLWVDSALQFIKHSPCEITIRIVDETESAELNEQYRHKKGPTNVLSFPFAAPKDIPVAILGDIIICAPVVVREAQQQEKTIMAHWAHMVVHGTLHLAGYDHITDKEAAIMEYKEQQILQQLGFPDPYQ